MHWRRAAGVGCCCCVMQKGAHDLRSQASGLNTVCAQRVFTLSQS